MNESDSEVYIQVRNIQRQLWLVLLSATAPFLLLMIAGVSMADSREEKLLILTAF